MFEEFEKSGQKGDLNREIRRTPCDTNNGTNFIHWTSLVIKRVRLYPKTAQCQLVENCGFGVPFAIKFSQLRVCQFFQQ